MINYFNMSDTNVISWLGNFFKFHTPTLSDNSQLPAVNFFNDQRSCSDFKWSLSTGQQLTHNLVSNTSKVVISRFNPFQRLKVVGDIVSDNCSLRESNFNKIKVFYFSKHASTLPNSLLRFSTFLQSMSGLKDSSKLRSSSYQKPAMICFDSFNKCGSITAAFVGSKSCNPFTKHSRCTSNDLLKETEEQNVNLNLINSKENCNSKYTICPTKNDSVLCKSSGVDINYSESSCPSEQPDIKNCIKMVSTYSSIAATSDSSLISSDCDSNTSTDGDESDLEDSSSSKNLDTCDTDTDESYFCDEIHRDILQCEEDVIDNTDSDDDICQWDRLGTARTPWTSYRSKQNKLKTAVCFNKSEIPKSENVSNESKKRLRKIHTSRIVESLNDQTVNVVARPTCDNSSISFILGCPIKNGYESDDEDDSSSWNSDNEMFDDLKSNHHEDNNSAILQVHTENMEAGSFKVPTKACSKVRFDDNVIVHKIVAWSFAYRQARIGPWTCMACDRVRFTSRIASVEKKIAWCLESKHREKIKALLF